MTINLSTEKGIAESVISKTLGVFQDEAIGKCANVKDDLWYWALLKTLRADMKAEKLYPPGLCYWINSPTDESKQQDNSPVQLHEVDDVETAFSEVTFATTMFTDQYPLFNGSSPHHYEGSLEFLLHALCRN